MKEHYTTAHLQRGAKYEFWHDVVCRQFVTADSVKQCEGGFDAELTCATYGRTQVSRFDAPAHRWTRERRHIRADDQDVYLFGVLRNGTGALEQNGRTAIQSKGNIAFYDTALPFIYDLAASINLLTIPRSLLEAHAPQARQLVARNLECDAGLATMLCEMTDSLLELNVETPNLAMVRERLSHSLLDIVLAILDLNTATAAGDDHSCSSMERMQTYARANLADPGLAPGDIARFGAVSTRTMNRLFGRLGTTPMRWVLQERVRLGERYLRENRARTVTEAAFMVGFNDISHFSRSFKQLMGYSPEKILRGDRRT